MSAPKCPAAYLRSGSAAGETAMSSAARERGWPEPDVYAELPAADSPGPALAELTAAVAAGCHDGLLLARPRIDEHAVMRLLASCATHGVAVCFVPAPAASSLPPRFTPDRAEGPPPLPDEPWSTLTRAQLEALTGLFPNWRIWLDSHGWHACRRGGHLQMFWLGAPAFHVRADSATELVAQLCWQHAARAHASQGCASGRLAETGRYR
jgi:hypothetical protein